MEPGNGLRLLHCGLDVSGEKSRQKSCQSNQIRCVLEDLSMLGLRSNIAAARNDVRRMFFVLWSIELR